MTVHGASLPGVAGAGQDRWHATRDGLIVLDGATSLHEQAPPADEYVDQLCAALAATLDGPADLRELLAAAIDTAAHRVGAVAGSGPSSTVLLARRRASALQVLVLGDSTALVGHRIGSVERLTDDRLSAVAPDLRAEYRRGLVDGHGYDGAHRGRLVAVQAQEVRARNVDGGYWIAEADPGAAEHAEVHVYPLADVDWLILATDGAQRPIDHLGIPWPTTADSSTAQLSDLLATLQQWETEQDPDGVQLPRAKRHDDKTLVVWQNAPTVV